MPHKPPAETTTANNASNANVGGGPQQPSMSRRRLLARTATAAGAAVLAGNLFAGGASAQTNDDKSAASSSGATSVASPAGPGDASNLPVRAVATTNVALSGLQVIDGVALREGDRVLLVGQKVAAQQGIWVAHAGAWKRPSDFRGGAKLAGAAASVQAGCAYANTEWKSTNQSGFVVDADSVNWTDTKAARAFVGVNARGAGGNFTLAPRTLVSDFGVPTFRSTTPNGCTALDLMPKGTPRPGPNDPGFTWIDLCDGDCQDAHRAITTARIGVHNSFAFVGAVAYGASAKEFHIRVPTDNAGNTASVMKFAHAVGSAMATCDGYSMSSNDPFVILNALGGSVVASSGYRLGNATSAGFLYIPQMAGAPLSTPLPYGNSTAIVYDTVNHKLWAFDGQGWKSSGVFS